MAVQAARTIRSWLVLACVVLAGCATGAGLLGLGTETHTSTVSRCRAGDEKPLARWSSVSGTLLSSPLDPAAGRADERIKLLAPVSVAASGNLLFIADAGQGAIFRFDRGTQTARLFAEVPAMNTRARLYLDRALSVYLADPVAGSVARYDLDGRLADRFSNANELPRPVAVVVDEGAAEILAGDGLSARILVFNRAGGVTRVLGADVGSGVRFQSIAAMALYADQLYVSDRLGRLVHALSAAGNYRYSFGADQLTLPGAIAADQYHRVYVVDQADQTIKIFRGGRYETVAGATGDAAGLSFREISDLWSSDGLLYVADSAAARVDILRIVPPCP